jgi:hypothetical protein
MNRWTHRLAPAALLVAPLLLTSDLFAQSRGDGQQKSGQAEPRKGHAVPRDDDQQKRAEQDKKRDEERRAEARRKDDERRRAEERRRLGDIRRPNPPHSGHVVFIGGYFYDRYYGPFPWWPPVFYPVRFPLSDGRAHVRIDVYPKVAAVYVDGYYAGVADDFDGLFQALPVVSGGHTVALYLAGYRTATKSIYLPTGSTFRVREQLIPLLPGEVSALPTLAPLLPEPPPGTYTSPRTPPHDQPTPPVMRAEVKASGFGVLSLRVQPTNAVVTVDGDEWLSAKEGELVVHLAVGSHAVTVTMAGRLGFSSEVVIRENEMTELNVSVPPAPRGTR